MKGIPEEGFQELENFNYKKRTAAEGSI